MKRRAGTKWTSIQKAFRDVDTDHSGTIGAEEMRRVLSHWCMEVSDEQFAGLMARWDADASGSIVSSLFWSRLHSLASTAVD